jgi:hypothetical protein
VTVEWTADETPAANYSWFIHLLDANGNLIAQQDRASLGGYTPTSGWQAGGVFIDRLYFNYGLAGSIRRPGSG